VLVLLLVLAAPMAGAVSGVVVHLGTLTVGDWEARDATLSIRLDGEDAAGPGTLSVASLSAPGGRVVMTDVTLHCPSLTLSTQRLVCNDGHARASIASIGTRRFSLSLDVDRPSGTATAAIHGLALAGGRLAATVSLTDGHWRASVTGTDLAAASLAELRPGPALGVSSGVLTGRVRVEGRGGSVSRSRAELTVRDLSFSDQSGLHAGEKIGGRVSVDLDHTHAWSGHVHGHAAAGQVYIDPVFTDLGDHPATFSGHVTVDAGLHRIHLGDATVDQDGVVTAAGRADLHLFPPVLDTLEVSSLHARLPAAYTTYLQPFAVGTPGGDLTTGGSLDARLTVTGGHLAAIALSAGDVSLRAPTARFAVTGLSGDLYWTDTARATPPTTDLRWRGGSVYGVDLGPGAVELSLHGPGLRLEKPTRLPLLDGALRIDRLALRDIGDPGMQASLDARLEPLDMQRLTAALGIPRFSGSLSGTIPRLDYRDGVLSLGGTLRADVFGGRVAFEDLRLDNPFGNVPELDSTVRLRGLDLETLTSAFSFGRITGKLDGDIRGLRLLGWRPAAFDAWFHTPDDDHTRHRISQKAVQNLADIGGSGTAAALSRGVLQIFDAFSYDRIGIGCTLSGTVCRMRGLAPAKAGGYYIVRGSGLPRVDIIGHSLDVSWPTLVEQIRSATASGAPVVQ